MLLWTAILLALIVFDMLAVSLNWPREWIKVDSFLILMVLLGMLYHIYRLIRSKFS